MKSEVGGRAQRKFFEKFGTETALVTRNFQNRKIFKKPYSIN